MENKLEDRVRKLRVAKGYSLRELARKMNLTATAISQWERGIALPKGKNLIFLAKKLDSTPEWILFGKEQKKERTNREIPFYSDISAFADLVFFCKGETEKKINIPVEITKGNENVVCIRVKDNSMEPKIKDGSLIGVDLDKKNIVDGKVYVIRVGNLTRMKTIFKQPQCLLLKSYNPIYNDELYNPASSDLEILGEVVWFFSYT